MATIEDERDITRLLNLYGHHIDNREWDGLTEVFTDDVVFDSTSFGSAPRHGFKKLRDDFEAFGDGHPIAHHATNIIISFDSDTDARVQSKGLCLKADGSVFSCVYLDQAVRTAAGWRLRTRTAVLRRPSARLATKGKS